jgi:type II secretory pathway component PulF
MKIAIIENWGGAVSRRLGLGQSSHAAMPKTRMLPPNVRLNIYLALANELASGQSVRTVMDAMLKNQRRPSGRAQADESIPNNAYAQALRAWIRGMDGGKRLGMAMRGWIPAHELRLVFAGEHMQRLSVTFTEIAQTIKQRNRMRAAILKGVTYPAVLMALATVALFVFGGVIIPRMEASVPAHVWTGPAYALLLVSKAVTYGWWVAILGAIGAIGVVTWSLPNWTSTARNPWDQLPPYSFYRFNEGVSFLLALQVLVQTGMRIEKALESIGRDASPYLRTRVDAIRRGLSRGQTFAHSLASTGYRFPDDDVIHALLLQVSGSHLDRQLKDLANRWSDQLVERVERQSGLLLVAGLVMVGMVIGSILVGVFWIILGISEIGSVV